MSAKKYNRVDGISRAAYPFLFGEEIDDNGLDGPTLSGKEIGSKIPGIGDAVEIGTDLGVCNSDCQGNPNSHVCTEDKYECNNEGFWVWLTGPESIVYKCNAETGMYYAGTVHQKCPCFAKCVMDDAGVPHCQDCPPKAGNVSAAGAQLPVTPVTGPGNVPSDFLGTARRMDAYCPSCSPAHDPNAKLGVTGLVAPGQTLTYTVQYENTGAGAALGVFVLDDLPPEFDLATLNLGGLGQVLPGSQTIQWNVGELAPKGSPARKESLPFRSSSDPTWPPGRWSSIRPKSIFPVCPK